MLTTSLECLLSFYLWGLSAHFRIAHLNLHGKTHMADWNSAGNCPGIFGEFSNESHLGLFYKFRSLPARFHFTGNSSRLADWNMASTTIFFPRSRDDTYWRLKYPQLSKKTILLKLKTAGYQVSTAVPRDDLARLTLHHNSGYVNYFTCTDEELQKFVVDRGMQDTARRTPNRKGLIKKLLNADKNPSFTLCLDLPAELRNQVYDFYTESLTTEPVHCPIDPPLARASRLLRAESLPIFYKTCTFLFILEQRNITRSHFDTCSSSFLKVTPAKRLQLIRNFTVKYISEGSSLRLSTSMVAACTMQMSLQAETYEVQVSLGPALPRRSVRPEAIIRAHAVKIKDRYVKRGGVEKPRASDHDT